MRASQAAAFLGVALVAVARSAGLFRRPAIRRTADALLSAVLVAFGVRLAAER